MAIKHTIAVCFLFSCVVTFSQTIQRSSVFGCAGNYSNIGTLQLQSNIGELMADTYAGSQNIFTQGFVQPEVPTATKIEQNVSGQESNVFPNPVIDKLNVQLGITDLSDVKIEVYDVLGKIQVISISNNSDNKKNYQLDFDQLNSGFYFIRIISVKSQFNKTFKVNKI